MGGRKLNELSVFFPVHNEEENISPLIEDVLEVIPNFAHNFEILLINDGSTDNTRIIAETLSLQYEQVRVITQENRGYGGALKTGFNNARYEWIFYSDGDRQFDLTEMREFIEWSDTYNFIAGYRKDRAEGLVRKLISFGLKIWNKFFFDFPFKIKDIDCAFKLVRRKVLDDVGTLVTDGGMISTELFLKAQNKGHLVKQLPVNHYLREYGSSSGDSLEVITTAIKETLMLLREFPKRYARIKLFAVSLGLFLVLLPVSKSITFMQNDDYTHYRLVEQFMGGNFKLDPYIGATFYAQGLLGAGFVFLFGIKNLPVLTLIVSISSFYILLRILYDFVKLPVAETLLSGFLLFLNPLFLYSIWGFMTENYFLLIFLISLYFIFSYIESKKESDFVLANVFIFLSYFVRQFAFVTSLAFSVYLFAKKRFAKGFFQLFLFTSLLWFHYNVFPITPQMYDGDISLSGLLNFDRSYSLLFVIGIYLSIFTLPLIISYFLSYKFVISRWRILSLLLVIPASIYLVSNFNPKSIDFTARLPSGKVVPQIAKVEFPYLENVFGRKGFLEDNLGGDKYHYPGFFDLFNGFDIVGKVGFVLLLGLLAYNYKYLFSYSFVYIAGFTTLLLVAPRIFDRYLLVLIPTLIILLSAINGKMNVVQKIIVGGYLLFLLFLGYQYSTDLIVVNKYVWERAEQLHAQGVPKEKINVNHSWRSLYPVGDRSWIYYFEYSQSKRLNSEFFEIAESHTIQFPGSIYLNPEILVFKRISL